MEEKETIENHNQKADEKVHNELEQSSMIIMIICAVVGAITILSGLSDDGIIITNITLGAALIVGGYISSLMLRWMASVLRQLNAIKEKTK